MSNTTAAPWSSGGRGLLAYVVCALFLALTGPAQASLLGGSSGLNPAFCKEKTFRQTVVYIDDTMMRSGQNGWAIDLSNRLDASLIPGEQVTVVQLSPTSGTSREIWSGCWPGYTSAQRTAIEKRSYFFSSNPLSDLKTQRSYFTLDLGAALTKIYADVPKKANNYKLGPSDLSHKDIIAALASDGARFAQSGRTIRAIVYSDLAQNSKLASVFTDAPGVPINYGSKLGIYFPHSLLYIYGVGRDVKDVPDYLGKARTFWSQVLSSMNATVEALGSNLVISNRIPVKEYSYRLSVSRNGENLFGRMSLLVDHDGHLVDSWIGISRLTFVAISGTFNCSTQASGCALHAKTNGSLTTSSSEETIDLSGTDTRKLSGTVGVPGALTFGMAARATGK